MLFFGWIAGTGHPMTALEKVRSGSLVIQAIGGRLNSGQVLATVSVKGIG